MRIRTLFIIIAFLLAAGWFFFPALKPEGDCLWFAMRLALPAALLALGGIGLIPTLMTFGFVFCAIGDAMGVLGSFEGQMAGFLLHLILHQRHPSIKTSADSHYRNHPTLSGPARSCCDESHSTNNGPSHQNWLLHLCSAPYWNRLDEHCESFFHRKRQKSSSLCCGCGCNIVSHL